MDGSDEILDYRNDKGHGYKFYMCDGVLRKLTDVSNPEVDREIIRNVQSLELRPDDVIVAAYPKCGTHWLWEIVSMVQAGSSNYSPFKKEVAMLGMFDNKDAKNLKSPRVLNSHNYFRHLPDKLVEKKIKIVHIMRNPKDVCVSYFNHLSKTHPPIGFEGSFSEFMELFLQGKVFQGTYIDYIKDWLKVERDNPDLPLFSLCYEDLQEDPVSKIQALAEFLGKPISKELCGEIADACSFTKLKTVDVETKTDFDGQSKTKFKQGRQDMYRKGKVGDWKNWLTMAQNEEFDRIIEQELAGTGIKFVYA